MTRVKVCGLMNNTDINFCVQAGAHALGFVVDYPVKVPWNLSAADAKELIDKVPPFVCTCIVTGGTTEKILNLANEICPDIVQLHYKENMREIREIAYELKLSGIKTIKALRIDSKGTCDFEISDPVMAVRELARTEVSAVLVDSYTESMPGGTGVKVDLSTFKKIQQESPLPVILAGGLSPANICTVIRETHPYAVDVLTGVEKNHECKDPEKIRKFMQDVRLGDS